MRSIIFALFLAICCIIIYTNAAALPENSAVGGGVDEASEPQFDDIHEEEEQWDIDNAEDGNVAEDPQSRTLFLLLPLLFPDQFYFS